MNKIRLLAVLGLIVCGQVTAQTTFTDMAPSTSTDTASFGRGSTMVDFDGDGLLDLAAANTGMIDHFYKQLPDHSFIPANDLWGIPPVSRHTWGLLAADFDNDGDDDVYAFTNLYTGQRNQLLRNDINTTGVFVDVSMTSGDAPIRHRNFGGTTLDYNRDGLLDIFVTGPSTHNFLLRNDGNLVFTDVSAEAGFVAEAEFRHCSSGDFNNDGWMDIAVGNYIGGNFVYRNNTDGTFTNVAASLGVDVVDWSFGFVMEDFDNDGWQDFWAPRYFLAVPAPATSVIFRRTGNGIYTNVTTEAGLTGQTDMGHTSGDVDGDGYPDIYIGTGHPGFKSDDILLKLRPDGTGAFVVNDLSDSSGVTSNGPTRCHGMALGDYDQDGFIDIYVNNGGPPNNPEEQLEENFLWRGADNGSNWTALNLTGVYSNRTAVGARAVAYTSTGREVHRMLRVGHGFANTDSHTLHFGIGADPSVERIVITWPNGIVQTVFEPAMGQVHEIVEQSDAIQAGQVPALTVAKAGDEITLSWSPSCTATDVDYNIYEGVVGHYSTHEPRYCTTAGETNKTFEPSSMSSYYLAVPRTGVWEGSHGVDSNGDQRPAPLAGACMSQSFGSCDSDR